MWFTTKTNVNLSHCDITFAFTASVTYIVSVTCEFLQLYIYKKEIAFLKKIRFTFFNTSIFDH